MIFSSDKRNKHECNERECAQDDRQRRVRLNSFHNLLPQYRAALQACVFDSCSAPTFPCMAAPEYSLQRGCDDGGTPAGAHYQLQLVAPCHNGGAHGGERALSRCNEVGCRRRQTIRVGCVRPGELRDSRK